MESKGTQQQMNRIGFDLKGVMNEKAAIKPEKKDEVERTSNQDELPLNFNSVKTEYSNIGSQSSSNSSTNNQKKIISKNEHQHKNLHMAQIEFVQGEASFKIGSTVEARNNEQDDFSRGKILRARYDGTFDVFCDDGKRLLGISKDNIRLLVSNDIAKEKNLTASFNKYKKSDNTEHVRFEIGTEVEARYRGKSQFYPGKIVKCRYDGSYDIHYNDGERELGVPKDLIRTPCTVENQQHWDSSENQSSAFLSIGTEVETRYRGTNRYCSGKILRKRFDGTFDILYNDGERELGVSRSMIRLKEESSFSPKENTSSFDYSDPFLLNSEKVGKRTERMNNNNTSINISMKSTSTNKEVSTTERGYNTEEASNTINLHDKKIETVPHFQHTVFSIGDKVEAKFRGGRDYYKGTIHTVLGSNFYSVAYDDGDFDERLSASNIRLITNDKDDRNMFKVGDEVQAIFGGSSCNQYYPGRIVKIHPEDDTFDIDYHDGDKEERVAKTLIRKMLVDNSQLQSIDEGVNVGDQVQARFRGTGSYYPGIISIVHHDNTVDIDYDDGDKDKKIPLMFVKKLRVVAADKEKPLENFQSNTIGDEVHQSIEDSTQNCSTNIADLKEIESIGYFYNDGFLLEVKNSIESIEKTGLKIVKIHENSSSDPLVMHQMIRLINQREKEASHIISIVSECLCYKITKESFVIENEYIEALKSHHSLMQCAMKCKETLDESAQENLDLAFSNFSRVYTKR